MVDQLYKNAGKKLLREEKSFFSQEMISWHETITGSLLSNGQGHFNDPDAVKKALLDCLFRIIK